MRDDSHSQRVAEDSATSERETAASKQSDLQRAWIDAYQEAQRQLVDTHSAFQRAMTDTHTQFLETMQTSLAALHRLAPGAAVTPPGETSSDELPTDELIVEPSPRRARETSPAASEGSPAEPEIEPVPGSESVSESVSEPVFEPVTEVSEAVEEPIEAIEPELFEPASADDAVDDAAQEPAVEERARPSEERFIVQSVPAPPVGLAVAGLAALSRVVVTDDGTGVATAFVEQLNARGVAAEVVTEVPADAEGVVFLGGLEPVRSSEDIVRINREAFDAARAVARRFTTGRGVFLTVQDTGGDFGLSGRAGERAGLGGLAGLAKTAAQEWPSVTVKAFDLERGEQPGWKLAKVLAEELFGGGPGLEIGLQANGARTSLESVSAPLESRDAGPEAEDGLSDGLAGIHLDESSVILATNGGQGLMAAALRSLSRQFQPRWVITGGPSLEAEPESCQGLTDEGDVVRALERDASAAGEGPTPEELALRARNLLAVREIRGNLEALRQAGSQVRYLADGARDADTLAAALTEVREEWGPITGLLHGAGAAADRLLAEKTGQDFDHVFRVKIESFYRLLDLLTDDPLDILLLFSSAIARSGERGQAEEVMADEVLNKIAAAEHLRRGDNCWVQAIGWAPWQGGGSEGHFEPRGAPRISDETVGRLLLEELRSGLQAPTEVILGGAPLGGARHGGETHGGLFGASGGRPAVAPMLTMDAFVSALSHPYLEGFRSGSVPELPTALALEWLVRLVRAHLPGFEILSCRELKILRRVELSQFYEGGDAFTLVSHQSPRGGGRELQLELYGKDGSLCATAVADLARPGTPVSAADETARLIRTAEGVSTRPWPFSKIYGHALFHGPELQVVREIHGVGEQSLVATLAGTREMGWPGTWRTDLGMLEGGLQLTQLWLQYQQGGASRIQGIGVYRPHFAGLVEGPVRAILGVRDEDPRRARCDLAFLNENGSLVAELRGVEARIFNEPFAAPEADTADGVDGADEAEEVDVSVELEALGDGVEGGRDGLGPADRPRRGRDVLEPGARD